MKNNIIKLAIFSSLIFSACGGHSGEHGGHHHGDANAHMHRTNFDELVQRFEGKERNEYQQPDKVMAYLGDVKGEKIMDIGAGTGYFSFRLAEAGASVIAADVDERFLEYIKEKKAKSGMTDQQISTRKVPYDAPNLADGELIVIDFFKKKTPVGPPVKMKISEEQIEKELRAAGFTDFTIEQELLPYQFIITAK